MKNLPRVFLLVIASLATPLLAQSPGHGTYSDASQAAPVPIPEAPLPSPPATAKTKLNGKTITVKYSSPAMRGRKIMGLLVPYGKVWRTGANPATSFVTAGDIMIGSLRVAAGSYTLYTLPEPPPDESRDAAAAIITSSWMLIINKQTGQWGTVYDASRDLGREPMHAATLTSPQQSLTIGFTHASSGSVEMHIRWETVDESVTITPAT